MGAWDIGVFDDDTSYDVLDDLHESKDIIGYMEKTFKAAMEEDYVDYDQGIATLVCSATIDAVINGTAYRCDNEDFVQLINKIRGIDLDTLKTRASSSLGNVISEMSELNELWSDNEELYDDWKQNIKEIIERLS